MIELNNYDQAIIISSDGDFYCLVKYLYEQGKLSRVISPDVKNCSKLLKKTAKEKIVFMDNLRNKLKSFLLVLVVGMTGRMSNVFIISSSAVLFVLFLSLFFLDSFNEFNGWKSIFAVIIHLSVTAIVLLATLLAWKRNLVGAITFFGLALYFVYLVGFNRHWSWYASISGPALLTAALFFINWLSQKKKLNNKV